MDAADARREQQQRAAAAASTTEVGVVTTVGAGSLTVNVTGTSEAVKPLKDTTYQVDDVVPILRMGGVTIALPRLSGNPWPTPTPLPLEGAVSATNSGAGTFTATTSIGSITVKLIGTMPSIGSTAQLIWQKNATGEDVVIGGAATATVVAPPTIPPATPVAPTEPAPVPPAPPPPPPQTGTEAFQPIQSGSWRDGKWRTDSAVVAQGTWPGYGANSGAYFYGYAPSSTLGNATITGCRVYLVRESGGDYAAQTINLYLHTSPTRPAGDVTRTTGPYAGISLPRGGAGWFTLPASWGAAIVAGGGLAITGAPYVNLSGMSQSATAGLLHIDWQR